MTVQGTMVRSNSLVLLHMSMSISNSNSNRHQHQSESIRIKEHHERNKRNLRGTSYWRCQCNNNEQKWIQKTDTRSNPNQTRSKSERTITGQDKMLQHNERRLRQKRIYEWKENRRGKTDVQEQGWHPTFCWKLLTWQKICKNELVVQVRIEGKRSTLNRRHLPNIGRYLARKREPEKRRGLGEVLLRGAGEEEPAGQAGGGGERRTVSRQWG